MKLAVLKPGLNKRWKWLIPVSKYFKASGSYTSDSQYKITFSSFFKISSCLVTNVSQNSCRDLKQALVKKKQKQNNPHSLSVPPPGKNTFSSKSIREETVDNGKKGSQAVSHVINIKLSLAAFRRNHLTHIAWGFFQYTDNIPMRRNHHLICEN